MSDKGFYLSELALEMLVASQNREKVILPVKGMLKKSRPQDLHAELYSMVSNNMVLYADGAESFVINEDLAQILKSMVSSKAVLRVTKCVYPFPPVYCYLSDDGIAELKTNGLRKGVRLSYLCKEELGDSIVSAWGLPSDYQNIERESEQFINEVDNYLSNTYCNICSDMLGYSEDEMKSKLDGVAGYVDLILNKNLKTVKRTAVFKKTVYYKIAEISDNTVNISNYSTSEFLKAIEAMTGEFL